MSVFTSAITSALATVRAVAGDAVTYRRKLATAALTQVVRGKTDADIATHESEFALTFTAIDFLVAKAQLTAASLFPPKQGDTITDATGTFEVTNTPAGECFRYSDPAESQVRIHTKQIV